MNVRYRVELSQAERDRLTTLPSGGRHAARKLKRAQILPAAGAGAGDEAIATGGAVGGPTVSRTKRRFGLGNLEAALSAPPRPGAMAEPTGQEELSGETVRRRLAENKLKPWRQDMRGIPKAAGTGVARMAEVLDLYAEAPDPKRPVGCFEESPTRLIGEVRGPIPPKPGQRERDDCEYRRNGTVNLFVCLDAHRPWRKVKVTGQRAARDFAHCMRDLVDRHYPQADPIRGVLDNLSTHAPGALYEAFPAPEAHRLRRRLEFPYTPKHARGLNMVESEIGVRRGQCLDRRRAERDRLVAEIAAWERQPNAQGARTNGMFTTRSARTEMARAYPEPTKES